jgi:hypothetical protein
MPRAIAVAAFLMFLPQMIMESQSRAANDIRVQKEKQRLKEKEQELLSYRNCFGPLFASDAMTIDDGYLRVISENTQHQNMSPLDFLVELKLLRDHAFNWTVAERLEVMADENEIWSFPGHYQGIAIQELYSCKQ